MKKLLWLPLLALAFLFSAAPAHATNEAAHGFCEDGNKQVLMSGILSRTLVQASYPQCSVYVYVHGGALATIYSDAAGTPLANPFTANANGQWIWYAADGRYDVTMTGGHGGSTGMGFPSPVTISDILLNTSTGGGGGGTPCTTTALSIQYNLAGSFACTPMTYTAGSSTFASTAINVNFSAALKVLLPGLTNTRIPFYSTNGLTDDSQLVWENTLKALYIGPLWSTINASYLTYSQLAPLNLQVTEVNPPEYSGAIQGTAISNRTGTTQFSQVIGTSGNAGIYGAGTQSAWGVFGQANGLSSVNTEYLLGVYGYAELDAPNAQILTGGFFEAAAPMAFTGTVNVFSGVYVPAMEADFYAAGNRFTGVPALAVAYYSGSQTGLGTLTAAFYAADNSTGFGTTAGANDYAFYSVSGPTHLGNISADKPGPVNGDIWYNSTSNKFRCQENSATVNCIGSGGGSSTPCTTTALSFQYNNGGSFGCVPMTFTSGTSTIAITSGITLNASAALKVLLPNLTNTRVPFYSANGLTDSSLLVYTAAGGLVIGSSADASPALSLSGHSTTQTGTLFDVNNNSGASKNGMVVIRGNGTGVEPDSSNVLLNVIAKTCDSYEINFTAEGASHQQFGYAGEDCERSPDEVVFGSADGDALNYPEVGFNSNTNTSHMRGGTILLQHCSPCTHIFAGTNIVTITANVDMTNATQLLIPVVGGGTQCLHASNTGVVTGTGSDCGGGGGGGANTALSNLASVAVNSALLPGTTSSIALGSASLAWSDTFIGSAGSGKYVHFNTSNLTGAVVIDISNTGAVCLPAPISATTHKFLTSLDLSAPCQFASAQPTLADIAAGASPTGDFNFAAATALEVPVVTSGTCAADGCIVMDTGPALMYHIYNNRADSLVASFLSSLAPSNGDLATFIVSGTNYRLGKTTASAISGLSGMTAGCLPKAATATTITGCSAVDDGITTASTITSTEAVVAPSLTTNNPHSGFINLGEGDGTAPSAAANKMVCYADATAHALKCSYNNGSFFNIPQTIASGASALNTSAISSGACATVVTPTATGTVTTDRIVYVPNADPTGVTGYAVSATGSLYIWAYPTADHANFKVCNNTSGSLTPGALTLNWQVLR